MSDLTPHQELVNRLKTGHPLKQVLILLDRIEALETQLEKPSANLPYSEGIIKKKKIKTGEE